MQNSWFRYAVGVAAFYGLTMAFSALLSGCGGGSSGGSASTTPRYADEGVPCGVMASVFPAPPDPATIPRFIAVTSWVGGSGSSKGNVISRSQVTTNGNTTVSMFLQTSNYQARTSTEISGTIDGNAIPVIGPLSFNCVPQIQILFNISNLPNGLHRFTLVDKDGKTFHNDTDPVFQIVP